MSIDEIQEDKEADRALLVGAYKGSHHQLAAEHLDELELLANTYGVHTAAKLLCPLRKYDARTLVTSGKLEELVAKAQEEKVKVVIFDDEITPAQQRNLEKVFGLTVMDRTELILGVFADRAQTREACLQVELAQTQYQFPRLKRLWTHLSRQVSGAGGFTKGEGEKQIEIDRRLLQRRVDLLTRDLEEVRKHREVQRKGRARSETPLFALVGYTNAGKSTLLNTLTGAGVFVEDKLFATLDPTTRKFMLPNKQPILLTDTVGFIRKLPHHLVAAFKSTLEEAVQADILLHLIDISDPSAEEHAEAALEVLKELGAADRPILTVLNKVDACTDIQRLKSFRVKFPHTVSIAARTGEGVDELLNLIMQELKKLRTEVKLRIPQAEYKLVSELTRLGKVLYQDYEDDDVVLRVEIPATIRHKVIPYEETLGL